MPLPLRLRFAAAALQAWLPPLQLLALPLPVPLRLCFPLPFSLSRFTPSALPRPLPPAVMEQVEASARVVEELMAE